ncbi:MAG: hypothetical protein ACI8WY_004135, partial [Planctomycetota bacterium]
MSGAIASAFGHAPDVSFRLPHLLAFPPRPTGASLIFFRDTA